MKKYGVDYITRMNKKLTHIRSFYMPYLLIKGEKIYISKNDKIIECKKEEHALQIAEDTYYKRINRD